MMQLIDLRGSALSASELRNILPRAELDVGRALGTAAELISSVREQGASALREQAVRLDGVEPPHLRVPQEAIDEATASLDPQVRAGLEAMIERVRAGSAAQVPDPRVTTLGDGAVVELRWHPVRRVGLYVPGGKAVYPSSVVMNVCAAMAAGVSSIAIASPPQREFGGGVHPTILGAAGLLGVTEVYAMGGAGAIGALAHGVPDVGLEPVEVITGPGNVYVAAAKRIVQAFVGIDSEAGPTEILVIADDSADADHVAADLVSQAEHDELASALLVTPDADWAKRVLERVEARAAATKHAERVRVSLGGRQSAVILVDDLAAAARVSNAYAPEHLEVQTREPEAMLAMLHNAGAIFMGANSPVSLGDYLAGSNHVLPTGGQAAHTPGLGAHTFLRPQQIIRYDREALRAVSEHVVALAGAEDLPAHGEAVTARFS
ncbi:histidinol dehydrogenase [Pseudoclavibacter sp. JSM 162008]|uniref:histidinol dehydrogenase n=1 Tax=Pseudoclavibacter sp. JSM 162008 TaxID=3229855 RepID=UPI0035250121